MPELELWEACTVPWKAGVSWYRTIIVGGDEVPNWNLLAEIRERIYYASDEVNLSPRGLCDGELLFQVPWMTPLLWLILNKVENRIRPLLLKGTLTQDMPDNIY